MLDEGKTVSLEERGRIIQGAMRLVEDCGMENVSAKTIGDSMGMEAGDILRVFPDTSALWRAVLDWIEARLMALLEHSAEYEHDAVAALEGMFKCHVSFIFHHPGMLRIVFNSFQADDTRLDHQVQKILRRYQADLVAMICLGKAEGTIRSEVDTQAAATYFIAMIQGLAVRMLVLPHCDRDRVSDEAQRIFKVYLDGIRV